MFPSRLIRVVFAAIFGVALTLNSSAFAQNAMPNPKAPWLRNTGERHAITSERLSLLLDLAKLDTDARQIIEDFGVRIGINAWDAVELLKIVQICDAQIDSPTATITLGSTQLAHQVTLVKIKDFVNQTAAREALDLGPKAQLLEDRKVLEVWRLPPETCSVCMGRDLTIRGAFDTLLHEMVHLAYSENRSDEAFLDHYPDLRTYVYKSLQAPEGEIEARRRGSGATIRVFGSRDLRSENSDAYFSDTGQLERPKDLYVQVRDQLKYGDALKEDYLDRLDLILQLTALKEAKLRESDHLPEAEVRAEIEHLTIIRQKVQIATQSIQKGFMPSKSSGH